ncbi:hypothetical protein, partial [Serratia marcescens]|uniref:hypothetical protein n=1 Tax=Serratia marcescens TaxID=615 RepID=UPI002814900C
HFDNREWDIKTMAMRESKDLKKLQLHELFEDLKAYQFEMTVRNEEPSYSNPSKALVVSQADAASTSKDTSTEKLVEQMSTMMALFTKKFGK